MAALAGRRLLEAVPVLIIVSVITFLLLRVVPGDPAVTLTSGGSGRIASAEELRSVREDLGLTGSYPEQYWNWIKGVVSLDFGQSIQSGRQVEDVIGDALPRTLELAIGAVVLSLTLALLIGVTAAAQYGTWADQVLRLVSVIGLALPSFWVGTLMLFVMVVYFEWVPPPGFVPLWEDPWTNFQQVIWPILALSVFGMAAIGRMTRSVVLDVLREDYIRTARAKGLPSRLILTRHALRPALLPVLGLAGIEFAGLIGGSVIVETLFNIPGTGRVMIDAIRTQDYPVVQTLVLLYAVLVVVVNLLVDLTAHMIDPRIRA